MSQQNSPDKMKRPRFFICDEVPRQIVSSAMAQVLSEWRQSTRAVLRHPRFCLALRQLTSAAQTRSGGLQTAEPETTAVSKPPLLGKI